MLLRFKDAPGIKIDRHKDGEYIVSWEASASAVKRGYTPLLVQVWRGFDLPTDAERAAVSLRCGQLQAEMLASPLLLPAPKFQNAPGIKMNRRKKDGVYVVFWQARTDLAKRGFVPPIIHLWRGHEPSDADRAMVSDMCNQAQADMLMWGHGSPKVGPFDGTVSSLIHCYQTDPDSPIHKLRFFTRQNYRVVMSRIMRSHGDEQIKHVRPRDVKRWHEEWSTHGTPMAHRLVAMFRILIGFGMTILEDEACENLVAKLGKMRFAMGKHRETALTAEQVTMIRAKAHESGLHSIALAQAFQYENAFRQKDQVGEWVPIGELGTSEITSSDRYGRRVKWLRGIRWNEIDDNLVLRHTTSKKQKLAERDLTLAPMVMEELTRLAPDLIVVSDITKAVTINRHLLPASGALIVEEATGLPYRSDNFRARWRGLARACGIPDHIKNMDTRAGAITEATDSGSLEDARHLAQHSDIQMTAKYSRSTTKKVENIMRDRAEFRKNRSGTSGPENA